MNMRGRQKVRGKGKKYSDKQAWSLYSFMAADIASGLRQFRKVNVNSFPGRNPMDTSDKWHAAVDEMIWAFDQINKDYSGSPRWTHWSKWHDEHPEAFKPNNFFKEVIDGESKVIQLDNCSYEEPVGIDKQEEEYYKRIHAGLRLFSDWYQDLWD